MRPLLGAGKKGSLPACLFFCQLPVVLVPLGLLLEGNRPEGITAALGVPVVVAVCAGPLSSQPEAGGHDGTCNNGHWCAVGMHARVWCRWPGVARRALPKQTLATKSTSALFQSAPPQSPRCRFNGTEPLADQRREWASARECPLPQRPDRAQPHQKIPPY